MPRQIRRVQSSASRLSYLEKSEKISNDTPFLARHIIRVNRWIFKGLGSVGLFIVTTAENLLSPNGCLLLGGFCAIAGLIISADTYYQQITGIPLLPFFETSWIEPVQYRKLSFWLSFQLLFSTGISLAVDWIQSLAFVANLVPKVSKLSKTQKIILTRIGLAAYVVEIMFTLGSRPLTGLGTYQKLAVFLYNVASVFGAETGMALAIISRENMEKAISSHKSVTD
ncbi:MAG: hypothetical protein F6K55_09410 [Moorea sp. SIO4A3]|nr:hypothetical protein [Moorena sp. SIO4A3]